MSNKDISEKLAVVRQSYIASLVEKQDTINKHWGSLCEMWNEEIYHELYIIIHGLAGSAETFGFPDITAQARSIVDQFKLCKDQQEPGDKAKNTLTDKISGLLESLHAIKQ